MQADVRLIAFDLDDTLTVSKSQIDPRMAKLLSVLVERYEVCIISGGRFEQFDNQVLRHLTVAPQFLSRLHLMPTCGTRYYRWQSGGWAKVYAEDFAEEDKQRIINTLVEGAKQLGLWETETWGEIIEDRGSQITFSALGQSAPPEPKYLWDPTGEKKRKLSEFAAQRLPHLEVRSGGSTSVDVTKKGVDKAYGMRKLIEHLRIGIEDVVFVGDRLDVGGNDYPVKAMGIRCLEVGRWQDTADLVEQMLSAPAAR